MQPTPQPRDRVNNTTAGPSVAVAFTWGRARGILFEAGWVEITRDIAVRPGEYITLDGWPCRVVEISSHRVTVQSPDGEEHWRTRIKFEVVT